VILRENVENLGRMGDLVIVASGYARNYLIPKKLAMAATDKSVKNLDHEKRLIAERQSKEKKVAQELADRLSQTSITISVKAGDEQAEAGGKIFGSVTSMDIIEALAAKDLSVDKRSVHLEKPIKELGTFTVLIKLHPEVSAQLSVSVVKG
jgi:large subunit ribosomal protein L9